MSSTATMGAVDIASCDANAARTPHAAPMPMPDAVAGPWRSVVDVMRLLRPHCRRHWRAFAAGGLAALVVVASRLALPWPLRAVTDRLTGSSVPQDGVLALASGWVDPVLLLGAAFLLITFLWGLGDLLERLWFARFAAASVNDLRMATLERLPPLPPGVPEHQASDLVARLVGDANSLKTALRGFLVQVATNGLVFAGVTVILFRMDWMLGLVFAVAGIGTALVTCWAAAQVFTRFRHRREAKHQLASRIQQVVSQDVDADSPFEPVAGGGSRQTRYTGIATWVAHSLFGLAVLVSLWLGSHGVAAGRIEIGDLMILMMYALLLRGPIVRLARQGAKTGRFLGAGSRLAEIHRRT